jgi:hypothetical protein
VRPSRTLSVAAAAGVLCLGQSGVAQRQAELTIPVGRCVTIEDSLERFACYEQLVDEAEAEAAETTRPAVNQAATDADFGLSAPDEERQRELPPDVRSVVTAIDDSRPNLLTVTLENGQIWRQMQSQRYHLRVGHHVRIYGTRWGDSYRLSADELYGFIQVERVK